MFAVVCIVGAAVVLATESSGYQLPLSASMMALMAPVAAAVALIRKVPVIEKNSKWALPLVSVGIVVALAFLTGQPDPVQGGIAMGIATCYAYDLGKGIVRAALPAKSQNS